MSVPPHSNPTHQQINIPPFFTTNLNNPSPSSISPSSSNTTPTRHNPRTSGGAGPEQPTAAAALFSTTQRSLQARGKAYNNEPGERNTTAESYEARQRRNEASAVLDSAGDVDLVFSE